MLYTRHARKRMRIRRVTPEQVESVYRYYDTAVPGLGGCRNYFKAFPEQRRKIRITIAETPAGPLVVTVTEDPLP
jgi:hypothetical protein